MDLDSKLKLIDKVIKERSGHRGKWLKSISKRFGMTTSVKSEDVDILNSIKEDIVEAEFLQKKIKDLQEYTGEINKYLNKLSEISVDVNKFLEEREASMVVEEELEENEEVSGV